MSNPSPGPSDQQGRPDEAEVRLLPHRSFDHKQLRDYLSKHTFASLEQNMLRNILADRRLLQRPCIFPTSPGPANDRSHYSHFQVYDVNVNGVTILAEPTDGVDTSKALEYWGLIKDTPYKGSRTIDIVGRVTIAREPSPILLAALHLTHSPFMDMRAVFDALGAHEPAATHTSKYLDNDNIRQIIFSLSYYTIIGDGCEPKDWQPHDEDVHAVTGVRLTRCNTVVAMAVFHGREGESKRNGKTTTRDRKKHTGSAWQVLNLQCFPDWKATTDVFETGNGILHAPDAFLKAVLVELQDAIKRFEELQKAVARVVTPSQDFLFRESLQDERLFDDTSFVWTKRYFWAHHVLTRVERSISEITEVLDDSFIGSKNALVKWPSTEVHPILKTSKGEQVLKDLKKQLEITKKKLEILMKNNKALIEQIRSLQSTLFNGTSVLESRRTVQQGENVKLLTIVNVFFLPLTFITSVFGMTNMPEDAGFVRFGIVLVAVCLPLFGFIGFASSHQGYTYIRVTMRRTWGWIKVRLAPRKKEKRDFDHLQHRRRHRFSRKESSYNDLEAPEASLKERKRNSSDNGRNEDPSHPHIKKMVEDIGKAT